MKQSIFIISLLVTICCSRPQDQQHVQYLDGRQLLTGFELSDSDEILNVLAPKSILAGDEFVAKITLASSDYKLVEAFANCESVASPSVDTTTYEVSGCKFRLHVEKDTIRFAFRSAAVGKLNTPGITVLVRDSRNIFRIIKYSLSYEAIVK